MTAAVVIAGVLATVPGPTASGGDRSVAIPGVGRAFAATRLCADSDTALAVPPAAAAGPSDIHGRTWIDGLLTGLIMSLAAYNLALFGFIRDRAYLFFALYGLLAALYGMSVQDYLLDLVWPRWPRWDSVFSWGLLMITVQAFIRFTQRFLNTAETVARGHRLLNVLAGMLVAGPLLGAPVIGAGWRQLGFAWNTALALTVFVTVIALAWCCHRQGFAPARAYLAGNTFFCMGGCLYGLGVVGVIPDQAWLRDTAQVGIVFQVAFFSLGIADRMARLRRRLAEKEIEKACFERELVAAKNRELEHRVEARTAELHREKDEAERLLFNILPREIARELRRHGQTTPRRHEEVSILFTDFAGFTVTAGTIPPQKLVAELDAMFCAFDDIIDRYGLEKIKTIGDSCLAVAGLPQARPDHAVVCVQAAMEMAAFVEARNRHSAVKWPMRIGIHSGTVVAGVVGKRKFTYDIWGDAVNIAARMECAAEPGTVNLSAYTYDLVREHFRCEYRGKIQVKGKGRIDMYQVSGPALPVQTTARDVPEAER